jgi:mono/diheme cytochrome c family protein
MKRARQVLVAATAALAGCSSIQRDPPMQVWPDMRHQKKFRAQLSAETYPQLAGVFPDGRQTRPAPEGTVARGRMVEDTPYNTGMDGKLYVGRMPVPVTEELIAEGQTRFNIYCAACHDRTGLGRGMVPQRALNWQPANLMEDRVVELADGDIFNVITYGRRTMPPYYQQVSVQERWAIIAYLRVLQRAAHASIRDVPEDQRAGLAYKGAKQ